MSPPISKDWWLAAALTSATLPTALAQPALEPSTAATQGAASTAPPGPYTVRPGDTLTRIASEFNLDWRDIARWNNIANPDRIDIGLVLRLTPPAPGEVAAAPVRRPSGVATTGTRGTGRRTATAPMYVTETRGQRLTTGPNESTHVLFSDQSAITVGPNSEVVITEYQYDPQAASGRLLLQMPKGIMRVVGGLLSKKTSTLVKTPTATIGIRGGISIVEHSDQGTTTGTFLFGEQMEVTQDPGGATQTVYRPGFGVVVTPGGIAPPGRTARDELARQLALLHEDPPGTGQPGEDPNLDAIGRIDNIAPDRVTSPEGLMPPRLADILGSQAPGNQS